MKGIVLRDDFTQIAGEIEKSVNLGEVVSLYDLGHAELPCADLRFRSRHQSVGLDCRGC